MQDITVFVQQHWQLSLLLLILLFILMILEFINQQRGALKLTPAQTIQLINRSNAVIVDLRPSALFSQGHIIHAISLPSTDLKTKTNKLVKYKSQPVILVCQNGIDSSRVADTLKSEGFDIHLLAGGMRAWRDAEMPIVKG